MSGYDDDAREMGDSFGFDDGGARDAATGAAVAQFIDDLRSLGEADPPTPNAELAAVLQGAPVPRPVRTGSGRKRVVVAVAASLLVGGAGVAAANGRLPQPAQRLVSDVVDNLTPFSVPARTGGDEPAGPRPTPPDDRVVVPVPVAPATHHRRPRPNTSESEPGDSESARSGPGGSEPDGSESSGTESSGTESGGTETDGSEPGVGPLPGSASSSPELTSEPAGTSRDTGDSGGRDSGGRDSGGRDSGGQDSGGQGSGGGD